MRPTYRLRPLGVLAGSATAFSALLLCAGIIYLGIIGYETFAPAEEPVIVVAADQDKAFYDAMSNNPPPPPEVAYADTATEEAATSKPADRFFDRAREMISIPAAVSLAVILIATIGFAASALTWVWRAHANLLACGIRTKHTPQRAVAGYIIPGFNLFLPFEAMRELYNRSEGEPEELANAAVDDVMAWWSATIIGLLIFNALIFKYMVDYATNLIIMTPLWMEFVLIVFAMLLLFGSTVLFANLTRAITLAQRQNLPALAAAAMEQSALARPTVRYTSRTE